ncbi:MAG: RNA-dependent DNA polymerase, partial [Planctomycetes bacterium]|nr:RNA-dependent DNA polymerase [Planctomycetota bacterium]
MKRISGLWLKILEWENLRLATTKALKAKRSRFDARKYMSQLETNLEELAWGLKTGNFPVGRYTQFVVHDPKER